MKISYILAISLASLAAQAQTNQYYNKGDITFQTGPSISLSPPINAKNARYGFDIDVSFWQTQNTATAVELGNRNVYYQDNEGFDHIDLIEKYRVTLASTGFLSRFSIGSEVGAETWANTGAKGTMVGLEPVFAVSKKIKIVGNIQDHFASTASQSGLSAFLGVLYKFN
jgi:hypothetical protein